MNNNISRNSSPWREDSIEDASPREIYYFGISPIREPIVEAPIVPKGSESIFKSPSLSPMNPDKCEEVHPPSLPPRKPVDLDSSDESDPPKSQPTPKPKPPPPSSDVKKRNRESRENPPRNPDHCTSIAILGFKFSSFERGLPEYHGECRFCGQELKVWWSDGNRRIRHYREHHNAMYETFERVRKSESVVGPELWRRAVAAYDDEKNAPISQEDTEDSDDAANYRKALEVEKAAHRLSVKMWKKRCLQAEDAKKELFESRNHEISERERVEREMEEVKKKATALCQEWEERYAKKEDELRKATSKAQAVEERLDIEKTYTERLERDCRELRDQMKTHREDTEENAELRNQLMKAHEDLEEKHGFLTKWAREAEDSKKRVAQLEALIVKGKEMLSIANMKADILQRPVSDEILARDQKIARLERTITLLRKKTSPDMKSEIEALKKSQHFIIGKMMQITPPSKKRKFE